MTLLVADTCVLISFATVHEMELLEATLRDRSHYTQAVEQELRKSTDYLPQLRPLVQGRWLGEAIELDTREDEVEVDRLRTALGGTSARPLQHLGEAESIRAITSRPYLRGAVLLTDDHDARDLARDRGVIVWDTGRVLADAHGRGDVGHPVAYDILVRMRQADRGVAVPPHCRDICPA
jgi:predicted nucleic acid-binding protein